MSLLERLNSNLNNKIFMIFNDVRIYYMHTNILSLIYVNIKKMVNFFAHSQQFGLKHELNNQSIDFSFY